MGNINDPIMYNWTLGWSNMGNDRPIVTPLLKAVIEKDISKMNYLKRQGASLKACDPLTLSRVIFHVLDDYNIMNWLLRNGMSRISKDIDYSGDNGINSDRCLSPRGYYWGVSGKAYYMKRYDILDLLCSNGFSNFNCYDLGWEKTWHADRVIFADNDTRAIDILLAHGYIFDTDVKSREWYNKYILMRPQVKRKTVALDPYLLEGYIPSPNYESVPLIFGKNSALYRNQRRKEDYEDRVREYQRFLNWFGIERIQKLQVEKRRIDNLLAQGIIDISKNY